MLNIIRASLFKLFRDRTFIVTAIIGVVLAAFMLGIYALIDHFIDTSSEGGVRHLLLTGENFYLSALTPGTSFGIMVPINLIVFTVGEFTYGTIRNKIIAGLSKTKIYFGLFITGLVFTFILAGGYALITIGLGSIIGGFHVDLIGGVNFALCYFAYVVCSYILVTAISIFFATLVRNVGGTIAVVIIILVFLASIAPVFQQLMPHTVNPTYPSEHWMMWVNPLYMAGTYGGSFASMINLNSYSQSPSMVASGVTMPLVWSAVFVAAGLLIFKHTDVK